MQVKSFSEIETEFMARISRIVWCTVATVDTAGRPRTRILHPIWEGATGYIATGRHSLKAKHLAKNADVSLCYWDPKQDIVYVEARTEWLDDVADRRRIWDLYKNTPPPLGYDPAIIPPWKDGPESPEFGVLKLAPRRIELSGLYVAMGQEAQVWTAGRTS
jgi:general stress protein 26